MHAIATFVVLVQTGVTAAQPREATVTLAPPSPALAEVLAERLARRRVHARIEQRAVLDRSRLLAGDDAAADAPLVRVYVDLTDVGRARLFFAHPVAERFSLRVVPLRDRLDEVGRESIGTVVESAVDSLLAGATFELSRAEAETSLAAEGAPAAEAPAPPRPAPPPPAPPPPAPEVTVVAQVGPPAVNALSATAAWSVMGFGAPGAELLSGPTLALGTRRGRWALAGEVSYFLPATLSTRPLAASLSTLAPRMGVDVRGPCAGRLCAGVGLRGGMDLVWLSPQAEAPGATTSPDRVVVSPTLGARAGVGWGRGALRITAAFTLDVDVLGTRFVVEQAASATTLAEAWRVRPGLLVGVGIER